MLKLFNCRLKVCILNADTALGVLDDGIVKPQSAGYRKGVRLAGDPDEKPVGRAQRLDIKLARCILDAAFAGGIYLEFGIVSRGSDGSTTLSCVFDDGDSQRRALGGVCSCTELIEKQQRAFAALS